MRYPARGSARAHLCAGPSPPHPAHSAGEVLFLGIVADPEETHAVWYGMLNALGIFDVSTLTDAENVNYPQKKHYFWFGEVGMAGIIAGSIAVPARDLVFRGADRSFPGIFQGAAVLFLLSLC